MKTSAFKVSILTLMLLLPTIMKAQGRDTIVTPPLKFTPRFADTTVLVTRGGDTLFLSPTPSSREIAQVFIAAGEGELDPFLMLQAVTAKSDKAVPALDTVLFTELNIQIVKRQIAVAPQSTSGGKTVEIVDTIRPNRLYGAMALEAMGTQAAYGKLMKIAKSHPSVDVRGVAVNALATTFHDADALAKGTPDKEIIHVLLSNVDDTTAVPYLSRSLGQLARQGLINWLDQDFGEPQGKARRLHAASGADRGSLADFREAWWNQVAARVKWDGVAARFRVQ